GRGRSSWAPLRSTRPTAAPPSRAARSRSAARARSPQPIRVVPPPVGEAANDARTGIGAGPIEVIASWLTANIGARVAAYAAGMSRADLIRVAHGEGADADQDRRVRALFSVCSYMAIVDGPGMAHDFLLEPNPDLG